MATSKRLQELILSKLDSIEKEVKQVRTIDIPNLKTEVAVVKEKSTNTAKIITGVGGAITLAVSSAVAWLS